MLLMPFLVLPRRAVSPLAWPLWTKVLTGILCVSLSPSFKYDAEAYVLYFIPFLAVTEKAVEPSRNLYGAAFRNFKSLFTHPVKFVTTPTFLFVCVVYGGTYMTANCLQSYCEFEKKDPQVYKLGGTTAVNMTLGVLKDRFFAQRFGAGGVRPFPLASWGLFIFRDTLTIGSGFTFPKPISKLLQQHEICERVSTADKAAQIFVPLFAQFFLTPIHLLSLDIYNNAKSSPSERLTTMRGILFDSWSIRILRTICAYSIAGIMNNGLRSELQSRFLLQDD